MSQDENASESEDGKEEGNILERGIDTDERAGRSQGIDPQAEPDDETKKEFEEERERRLDPENRPDNTEVDNTQRDFDVDRGMFTDRDDYAEDGAAPYADPEDPASQASDKSETSADKDEDEDASGSGSDSGPDSDADAETASGSGDSAAGDGEDGGDGEDDKAS